MTAYAEEQKERARHEVEVEKARQLKRIADALESLAMAHLTLRAETVPMSELVKKVDGGAFDRSYILTDKYCQKEDLKNEQGNQGIFFAADARFDG